MSNRGGFDNQLLQIEEVRIRWKCFVAAFGEMKSRLKFPEKDCFDISFVRRFNISSRLCCGI